AGGRASTVHRPWSGDPPIHHDLRRRADRSASADRTGRLDPRGQPAWRRRVCRNPCVARVREPRRLTRTHPYRLLPRAHLYRGRRVPRPACGVHRRPTSAVPGVPRLRQGWRGAAARPHRGEQHDPARRRDRRGRARRRWQRGAPARPGAYRLGGQSRSGDQARPSRPHVLRRHLPARVLMARGPARAREGGNVITVSFTFFATVEAILYANARPILVEIDEETMLMDTSAVAAAITPRTKAIIPVHLYGRTVDLRPLRQIAQDRNITIIEDAAQAHGALLDDGKKAGNGGRV